MSFCPLDGCPHYSEATIFPRKCYYEPQCWKGRFDVLVHALRHLLAMRRSS